MPTPDASQNATDSDPTPALDTEPLALPKPEDLIPTKPRVIDVIIRGLEP